ncbi:MarR family transcriptional regulator [Kaistia geumhonensis]|uniref:DNA-binding MarR family transcriptional regulator n=1 Tax=Kaistia geumhonensis TaxID=410839 RepID=A0ABU0MBA8_9HYPH|nr:MarR family transcriptional regulator [Kaistia geumhonensis]MCX5481147.1 MarR family transcriptional regulator [Kaistia geumhonensis]MDQ0518207.1 DNA-binding MarR family transcriptional regulator [Kaistia geumhonensis]
MERSEDRDDGLPADRDGAVARIDVALGRLRRSMIRRGLGRRVLDELGLAIEPALVEVVDVIDEAGRGEADGVSVATVAERLVVDPSQASRLVAEAVRAGFVERLASQADGRRSLLELTDSGRELIAATRKAKRRLLRGQMDDWSDADVAAFADLLARFSAIARG